jgi:hypothetical protein
MTRVCWGARQSERHCTGFLAVSGSQPYIGEMNLKLNDVQTEGLVRELSQIIQNDRYPSVPALWH